MMTITKHDMVISLYRYRLMTNSCFVYLSVNYIANFQGSLGHSIGESQLKLGSSPLNFLSVFFFTEDTFVCQ